MAEQWTYQFIVVKGKAKCQTFMKSGMILFYI